MQRLRLLDLRLSRLPTAIGVCASDTTAIAAITNSAERQLIMAKEAGDEGWWGTWAEIAFSLSRSQPYLTMPRSVARLEAVAVCDTPVQVNNQFYEYLRFGNGRLPKRFRCECHRQLQVFSRNNTPGFVDLTNPPQHIAVYLTDSADNGTRVLIQGRDANGEDIYTLDGGVRVKGVFVTVTMPFTVAMDSSGNPYSFSAITGYQKGGTVGYVQFQQLDPSTGATVLLHTMEPGETTGWYRRYYFDRLPWDCCAGNPGPSCSTWNTPGQVQVTAIVKLDPVPVRYDTDYYVLQNIEALIEQCESIRYGEMDTANGKNFQGYHHRNAIGFLNGELAHYLGRNEPSLIFAPFGSARLERQKIGQLI
jgi:hypothetical protein